MSGSEGFSQAQILKALCLIMTNDDRFFSLPLLSAVSFVVLVPCEGPRTWECIMFQFQYLVPELLFQFQQLVGYSFALHNWKRVASRKVGKVKLNEQRAICYDSPVTLVAQ
ncbi:unnamed protein product [Linum trigynum]|uniref:Uncharacterized protein n=1 Tax=Linum trigynum TaxID=586398 RepID=A0AAV2G7Q2_9ROSI